MRPSGLFFLLLAGLLFAPVRLPAAVAAPAGRLGGYLRWRPAVETARGLSAPRGTFLLHNRLNCRLVVNENSRLRVEAYNRLLYRGRPAAPVVDEGAVDLATTWLSGDKWLGQGVIDRLYLEHAAEDWRLRLGRQRVNWGVNLVSNPNDLFNVYSFFDFDYPERPGADAVRVEYFRDHLSTLEFAAAAGPDSERSVFAFKYLVNHRGYDFQVLAGRCRRRPVLGAGWAGNLREAGFRGEMSWFHGRRGSPAAGRGTLVASLGVDYMFAGGTYLLLEGLYNGGHGRVGTGEAPVTGPLRPDNIMFSRLAATVSLERAFSPILRAGLTVMAMPDIDALYLHPTLRRSLTDALDLELAGQFYAGGRGTPLGEAGALVSAALNWSF